MASRGDHQGPWVRCVPALLLLGHGTHTRGYTTKSKDLGKSSQDSKETRGKVTVSRLEGAQKGKGQQGRAGRKSISTSYPPAPSLQRTDSKQRKATRQDMPSASSKTCQV